MLDIESYLTGGDLRSVGGVDELVRLIDGQDDFDVLFEYLHSDERLIVMRTADAVEKVTRDGPHLLQSHKDELFACLHSATHKEFKWHLAQLVSRLSLTETEVDTVWDVLSSWATDPSESRIVRVNALQALHDLTLEYETYETTFDQIVESVRSEDVPSIQARIRQF